MGSFVVLDHIGEIGVQGYGRSLGQAFSQAARGMFSLMVELESIEERESRQIEVRARDLDALLVAWLNELVYLFDLEGLLFRRFVIGQITQQHLQATCWGEPLSPQRHQLKLGVKAATYHMAEVRQDNGWQAKVILDI